MEANQLEQLKRDPVAFVEVMANVQLFPQQEKLVKAIMAGELVIRSRAFGWRSVLAEVLALREVEGRKVKPHTYTYWPPIFTD